MWSISVIDDFSITHFSLGNRKTLHLAKRPECTVKILFVILTTILWLIFITTLWTLPLDDTVFTHVISIGNWNLGDETVVTNNERVAN